ncbi:uncharacterized protein LOC116612350 [Nematostella vectensis]|uniref:uncharacterized protein LOC116612350 n=1 Tax=Nematostella vectensis TaxID=45351 RepID=UPI0013905825|nr:uncharacterized protein LOC116612350 [Nematostella vectensis]
MDELSNYLTERDRESKLDNNGEVRRIQYAIESVLKDITKSVQERDHRFAGTLIPVGSFYSDLKIGLPGEFDFIYELSTLEEGKDFEVMPSGFRGTRNLWRTAEGDPGKKKIFLKNPKQFFRGCEDASLIWIHKTWTNEFVLDPIAVKNSFFSIIGDVVESIHPSNLPRYLTFSNVGTTIDFVFGPAITLFFNWSGRAYPNLTISVDMTIAIKAMKWRSHFDFLSDKSIVPDSFMRKILLKGIRRHGYHLVPNTSGNRNLWKLSTSFLETRFFMRFPKDAKIKQFIRVMKCVKCDHLKNKWSLDLMKIKELADIVRAMETFLRPEEPDEFHHLVSSYLVKTSAFTVCAGATSTEWKRASLAALYLVTLCCLYNTIKRRTLSNFFISRQKLNAPVCGEVIPGFHVIFQDIWDVISKHRKGGVDMSTLKKEDVFNPETVLALFEITKDEIDLYFSSVWNSEKLIKTYGFSQKQS